MIIYNTTFTTDEATAPVLVEWIKTQYLPQALVQGMVRNPQLARVLGVHDGNVSYALQLQADSLRYLQRWYQETGKDLAARVTAQFGDKVVAFATMLEKVQL